jgi:hypothetical protein
MDSSEEPKWKIFEKLVAGVQKELAPNATIKHDDQIWGQDSDTYRQVDISIRNKVGQFDLLIGIDCKDYKRPVDIGEVEAFGSKIKDIRANKGAIVASNGFTSGAINLGKNCGIDLYRLIDAEAHDWQTYISIPVLCDFRSIDQYHFAIPDYFGSQDPYKIMLHDTNEHQLGNLVEMLVKRWNAGKVSTEPGRSGWINLTDNHEKVEVSGKFREVHVEAEILVRSRLYF